MSANYDALVDLLDWIKRFSECLEIYTKIPAAPAMDEIVVNIMAELLSTFALATKRLQKKRPSEPARFLTCYLTQCISVKSVKRLLEEREVEAVLQRLHRLSQDEARITAPHILEVIYGLVHNLRLVMDSEQPHSAYLPLAVE
jgi:hypothetical protein